MSRKPEQRDYFLCPNLNKWLHKIWPRIWNYRSTNLIFWGPRRILLFESVKKILTATQSTSYLFVSRVHYLWRAHYTKLSDIIPSWLYYQAVNLRNELFRCSRSKWLEELSNFNKLHGLASSENSIESFQPSFRYHSKHVVFSRVLVPQQHQWAFSQRWLSDVVLLKIQLYWIKFSCHLFHVWNFM